MGSESTGTRRDGVVVALLDVRKLACRCRELEADLQEQERRRRDLEAGVEVLTRDREDLRTLAAVGERTIARWKEEILSRLRAIVHHTGERDRLRAMESFLCAPERTPEEIRRRHEAIDEEFRFLYPVRSRSFEESLEASRSPAELDWTAFQMRRFE